MCTLEHELALVGYPGGDGRIKALAAALRVQEIESIRELAGIKRWDAIAHAQAHASIAMPRLEENCYITHLDRRDVDFLQATADRLGQDPNAMVRLHEWVRVNAQQRFASGAATSQKQR